MTENLSASSNRDSAGVVMLPCTQENFADFISGLLGQPQEITRAVRGSFTISRAEVEQVHHLVMQRVQQNRADLVQFSARIGFVDGSSVLLNSFLDFQSYFEVRPVVSDKLIVTWTFLVNFPTKQTPEKQEIALAFISGGPGDSIIFEEELPIFFSKGQSGYIRYRISHTSRTWGGDIESLLDNYVQNTLESEPRFRKFARQNSTKIGLLVAGLFLAAAVTGLEWTQARLITSQLESLKPVLGASVQAADKMDYLLKSFAEGSILRLHGGSNAATLSALAFSVILGFFVGNYADTAKPSFLLFSEKAKKDRESSLKRYERHWRKFIGSIIVGICVGVLGNFAYDFYWKEKLSSVVKVFEPGK
jgi:hypothetical protein